MSEMGPNPDYGSFVGMIILLLVFMVLAAYGIVKALQKAFDWIGESSPDYRPFCFTCGCKIGFDNVPSHQGHDIEYAKCDLEKKKR